MKLHIYLFRHGQSTYNKKKWFTGWKDSKLTKQGIKDAKIIAKKLKGKKIDLAFQTRLSRSKDTLKEVLKHHPECKKIITDDRMIERCYGDLQGKGHDSIKGEQGTEDLKALMKLHLIDKLHPDERDQFIELVGGFEVKIFRRSYDHRPPGGESVKDVEERVSSFIKDLKKLMRKEKVSVVISAHGNSMRPFRRHFEKLSLKEMMTLENPWDDYFHYVIDV